MGIFRIKQINAEAFGPEMWGRNGKDGYRFNGGLSV